MALPRKAPDGLGVDGKARSGIVDGQEREALAMEQTPHPAGDRQLSRVALGSQGAQIGDRVPKVQPAASLDRARHFPLPTQAPVGVQRQIEARGDQQRDREVETRVALDQLESVVDRVALELDMRQPAAARKRSPSSTISGWSSCLT